MAEAEDVLVDAARHATSFAQDFWRRHGGATAESGQASGDALALHRLDLLLTAAFGPGLQLRFAQPPLASGWMRRWMAGPGLPQQRAALPATDGSTVWIARAREGQGAGQGRRESESGRGGAAAAAAAGAGEATAAAAFALHKLQALRQALRARRGAAALRPAAAGLPRDLQLLLEARAADHELLLHFAGLAGPLAQLRRASLALRPAVEALPAPLRPLEQLARRILQDEDLGAAELPPLPLPAGAAEVLAQAQALCAALAPELQGRTGPVLFRDAWTGDLLAPSRRDALAAAAALAADEGEPAPERPRSARLAQAPRVREATPGEDDHRAGASMVQTAQPHEAAEDPMGMQRPADRDTDTPAQDFADALSELPEARLVSTPGKPKEVLLAEQPLPPRGPHGADPAQPAGHCLHYPEWDWRRGGYRLPGAAVHLLPAAEGDPAWLRRILQERAPALREIRRHFELLRARRVRLRRQLDGDTVDLDGWIEALADFRAGLPLSQRLYQTERCVRRDLAVSLLVDVSGSTDAWLADQRRIIDVEREALLLVCIALEQLGEPYEVLAFSGEGPQGVVVRGIKAFGERFGPEAGQRIAGLEPEHYTRAGAAVRHATAGLMRQPVAHRLLLLLSDGRPNDVDEYEGRYGVEDLRQAVAEARLQGLSPFCLTIDRHAAGWLPAVFGAHHYTLLSRPERLPAVLLQWLRRLVTA